MVTPEQQLALSYTALSGNKLSLLCIQPFRPDKLGLHCEGVHLASESEQNSLLSSGVLWVGRFKWGKS